MFFLHNKKVYYIKYTTMTLDTIMKRHKVCFKKVQTKDYGFLKDRKGQKS